MFKHCMEIVHNHGNGYRDCFTRMFFLRESQLPLCLSMVKDSQLRDYLEVYSLSSDQVFLSIQLKTCLEFSRWTC